MIITKRGLEAARRQGALTRRRLEDFLAPYAAPQAAPPRGADRDGGPGRRGDD